MSDFISREERRLIDEAIAEGRVQKIPQGQSSFDVTETLTRAEALKRTKATYWGSTKARRSRVVSEATMNRRRQVRQLVEQGKSKRQIASLLDVSTTTISKDAERLGIKLNSKRRRGKGKGKE